MKQFLLFFAPILISLTTASAQQSRDVEVVVSSPRGEIQTLDQSQTVFVSFNQPMTALKEVPVGEDSGPLVIEPAIAGKYRWMGTSTLSFIPADTLPFSTRYKATIPAGTKSVSGQILKQDYSWTFETPSPRLLSYFPNDGQVNVELNTTIELVFNQPIDPQTAAPFISLHETAVGSTETITFQVKTMELSGRHPARIVPNNRRRPMPGLRGRRTPGESMNGILIVPDRPFKKSAAISVKLRSGLPGIQGNIGMKEDAGFSFSTFGEFTFLKAKSWSDEKGPIDPFNELILSFSNPVSVKAVADHLTLDPMPAWKERPESDEWTTEDVPLAFEFMPEQLYKGTIKAGLTDRFGNVLDKDVHFTFTTAPYKPYVTMPQGIGVIEAREKHQYPFRSLNTDSVFLSMCGVGVDDLIPTYQNLHAWGFEGTDEKLKASKGFTVNRWVRIKGIRNKMALRILNLDEALPASRTGTVLVQIDSRMKDQRYLKAMLQVTNLGITSKFSPENNLIWVTRLNDASPVSGAQVEIRNDQNAVLWKGTTDADGLAKSPGWGALGITPEDRWSHPRQWVIVKSGEDAAFSSSDWTNGIEPYQFGLQYDWNPKTDPLKGVLFTDRGLYKAGETVEVKGVVRLQKMNGWKVPQETRLRFKVEDPRNEEMLATDVTLSEFGSFNLSIPLKPNAPLGYYNMRLEFKRIALGKETWEMVGGEGFRVEAFRPAEFEVTAKTDRERCVIGDSLKGFVSARYLFGAAMKLADFKWRLSASRSSWSPDGYDGYYFGPLEWLSNYAGDSFNRLLASGEGKLDAQGGARIDRKLAVGELRGPTSILFEADVTSPTRQVVSGRSSVLVHGGEYYVGIGPSTTFINADSVLTYKIVAVDTAGQAVSDQSVSVKVYKRIWRSVRKAETGGRYAWESQVEDTAVDSSVVTTASSPVELKFTPKEPGFYHIDAKAKDPHGNEIETQAYFYASGSGYVPWERRDDDRIELIADKTEYGPGDNARIIVKSPYEKAKALVSVEREGILRHFTAELVGSAPQIEVPVLKEDLPNVFVSVVLLQGRVENVAPTREADVGRPSFKVGYIKLSVNPVEKKLTVFVDTDKPSYQPGDSVEVRIRVQNVYGIGTASEVTLSVADLGVLNLIGYRFPKLFDDFYAERGLAVTTSETRMHLVEQRNYDEKGEPAGGGGGMENAYAMTDAEGLRKDFRPTAYWNPSVMTDGNGDAVVRFKLPDNLTGFEVMASAHTVESDFGYGETAFTVNKPLLLQPVFPRFARVGDSFESGAFIFNYSNQERSVQLISTASGVQGTGSDTTVHVLKPGQALEARRKYRAEKTGTAMFTFKAVSENDRDGFQWTIPIQTPSVRETVALFESTVDEKTLEKVTAPTDVYAELGGIEFKASSTAMVGLSGGMSYLFTYPYGCLEQRVSCILPIILSKDLVEAFDFEVFKDKDAKKVVQKTLDEIPSFQNWNGGFTLWKGGEYPYPWTSAYAMNALVQAERNDYKVDKHMMENGLNYLRQVLKNEIEIPRYLIGTSSCTKAFILYTLALAKKPEFGYMEQIYRGRADLPLVGKAYLLKALVAAKGNKVMIDELSRDLMNLAKIAPTSVHFEESDADWLPWIWNSTARTTALVMQALAEAQPENTLIPKAVRWLLDERRNGRWRTTQENVYVVDALATYFRTYEKDEPDFKAEIRFAGRMALEELFKGRSMKTAQTVLPMTGLKDGVEYPVDIQKQGLGRLYYGVSMNYYPKGEVLAKEEGLSVQKAMETVEGPNPVSDSVPAGSLVRVTLTISSNQARNFVVIDDPLPAGLEAVNTSFQTTAQTGGGMDSESGDEENWWRNPFNHVEQKDDRVLLFADYLPVGAYVFTYMARATSYGSYRMPSTRAEGMYEPEVFGQTASKTISVK